MSQPLSVPRNKKNISIESAGPGLLKNNIDGDLNSGEAMESLVSHALLFFLSFLSFLVYCLFYLRDIPEDGIYDYRWAFSFC